MKTREEIEAMFDEERRIRTAEIRGWTDVGVRFTSYDELGITCVLGTDPVNRMKNRRIPDCLNSLGAMHEAEVVFESVDNVMLRREYVKNLADVVEVNTDMERWSFIQDFILLHATARQRNCAFLMTLL